MLIKSINKQQKTNETKSKTKLSDESSLPFKNCQTWTPEPQGHHRNSCLQPWVCCDICQDTQPPQTLAFNPGTEGRQLPPTLNSCKSLPPTTEYVRSPSPTLQHTMGRSAIAHNQQDGSFKAFSQSFSKQKNVMISLHVGSLFHYQRSPIGVEVAYFQCWDKLRAGY